MKKSQVVVFVGVLVSAGCTANEPSKVQNSGSTSDAGHIADASNLGPKPENVFTHKMIKPSGENQFASLAYECPECSFEQHLAINTPAGWTKGPSQVAVFSSGEMRSTPSFDGVPEAVDFVAEIPGNEYKLIAKNLDARIIEAGSVGLVVEAQVMSRMLCSI